MLINLHTEGKVNTGIGQNVEELTHNKYNFGLSLEPDIIVPEICLGKSSRLGRKYVQIRYKMWVGGNGRGAGNMCK